MGREVLFRGKRRYTEEWAESVCPLGVMHAGHLCDDFIPETVGQYAEICDLNGKKVFEGDFVRLTEDVKRTFNVEDGPVLFGRGGFYVKSFGLLNSFNAIASADWVLRGVVIGNIHDNPELLIGETK